MKAGALIPWVALLLLAPIMLPATGQGGAGTTLSFPQAPWWGPGDEADRTVGFHFRFPVLVTNEESYPMVNALAQVEVDLGKLLIQAGWNGRSLGAQTFPTSFELDPTSLRVISYEPGFRQIASETPLQSRFHPGRFSMPAEASFDAARNPVGTVVFLVDGTLAPGSSRSYMVYFTSVQQGERPDLRAPDPLDGWPAGGWGTRAYGHQPALSGGIGARTDIVARFDATKVEVFEFKGGRPVAATLAGVSNPFTLGAGESQAIALRGNSFFMVEADKPVLVGSRGKFQEGPGTYGGGAFVPSTGSSLAGKHFLVPAYAPRLMIAVAGLGASSVTATMAGASVGTLELSSAKPAGSLQVPVAPSSTAIGVIELRVSGQPVVVQYGGSGVGTHTIPARTGAVGGHDTFVLSPAGTVLRLYAEQPTEVRVLDALAPAKQVHPFGRVDKAGPALLMGLPQSTRVQANESYPDKTPVRIVAETPAAETGAIYVHAGSGGHAGPFLLGADLTTVTRGPLAIMGAHDGTTATIIEFLRGENRTRTETINRNGVVLFEPDPSSLAGEALIKVSKPAALVGSLPRDGYARTYPAFGGGPTAEVGALEFRGALLRLRILDAVGGQAVRTVGPGQTAAFEVEVSNVGHWMRGAATAEEVQFSCSDPGPAWKIEGCQGSFTLASGQTRRARIFVTPGDVTPGGEARIQIVAHGARWNVTDQGQVALLVREDFGVAAWFYAEGGPTDLRDAPFPLDRGSTIRVPVVIENTGTVKDTYDLRLREPASGWQLALLDGDDPVSTATLDPGQQVEFDLEIVAPPTPERPDTLVDIEAVSASNELAFAKLLGRGQIITRLDVGLSTKLPVLVLDPGSSKTFPVDVTNDGEAVVTVAFELAMSVPRSWNVTTSFDEIIVFPGNTTRLDVTVTTPTRSAAGERGTISLNAQASRNPGDTPTERRLNLTGLVRHVHDIGSPTEPVPIRPGKATEINLPLVNNGNGPEELRVLGLSPPWPVRTAGPLVIEPGEVAVLSIEVDLPSDTPAGATNLTIHASLSRQQQANLTIPLDVQATPSLTVELEDPAPFLVGKPVTYLAEVSSTGNVALEGTLGVRLPEGWTFLADPPLIALGPGESEQVTYTIEAPPTEAGTTAFRFTVDTDDHGVVASPQRQLPVGQVALRLSGVQVDELDDGGLLVRALVTNNGTVAARGVVVALQRGDALLATATVERIAVNDRARVSLATQDTSDPDGLVLIVDPEELLADADRSDNVVALSELGTPFIGLGALVALLGSALATRRWRR